MKRILIFTLPIFLLACEPTAERADAYGNFEATVTTVSAEASGRLLFFSVEEGQRLDQNAYVGLVDTTIMDLQRRQLMASIGTLPKKMRTADPDIRVLQDQRSNLIRERDRIKKLVAAKAATPKQLDDLNGEIEVVDQRIQAAERQTQVANRGILAEKDPLLAQVDLLDEQIRKAYLFNPVAGTVLTKLAEASEIVGVGSPLYRIASLDTLVLRAYAGSVQLQSVRVGQEVNVRVDQGEENYRSYEGKVVWISDQAEFTPKTIQTKEERVNLVYATKITVPNPDGTLKIGMPAEVDFIESSALASSNEPTGNGGN